MRKILCLLLGMGLLPLLSTAAPAQGAGLEIHGLYAFSFDGKVEGGGKVDLDNTLAYGGASLVLCLGPNVKLDLGADYLRPELKDASGSYIILIPVAATLRVGGNAGPVFLYVGGGGGYSFNDLDLKGGSSGVTLEDSFTYHACGGAEFGLSPNIALRAEFRYVWNKPELKDDATGSKIDWTLNQMQGRAGLAFYF